MSSSDRIFMMGEFEARFPADRRYAKNHMWGARRESVWRFGFSAYAVRLLQDVYFLDWTIEPGMELAAGQEIGAIESKKAEASLYAPAAGRVTAINQVLLQDPSGINVEPYESGWLFELSTPGDELMTPDEYLQHLEEAWELTQRTIKGQLND